MHVVLNIHEGGLERVIGDLVRGSDRSRFECHVLALKFLGHLSAGLEAYAQLHVAPPMSRLSMLRPAALAAQIRDLAPDVVHTHSGVWYKATRAARMARVPFVVHTDHGRQSPDPWPHRWGDGRAARRTDVVVAVSETLGQQLAETVVPDPTRIRVILNGVDTERFRPRPGSGIREEIGVGPTTPVLGSIGRLDPIKRFDLMIEAFATLIERWTGPDRPHLVIAGDGPERSRLNSLVADRKLGDRIHLLGWRDDVADLHATFAIFTMSSRSEGTSIGLLEAMSTGICPVVTDVGGNRRVLGDRLIHRLCRSEDPEALVDAWRAALENPGARHADGEVARRRVEEEFSARRMVRTYEELYLEGLERSRS